MKGRPWTKGDKRVLKLYSKERAPIRKIAKWMKRTEGALRQKAFEMEIGLGHRRYR